SRDLAAIKRTFQRTTHLRRTPPFSSSEFERSHRHQEDLQEDHPSSPDSSILQQRVREMSSSSRGPSRGPPIFAGQPPSPGRKWLNRDPKAGPPHQDQETRRREGAREREREEVLAADVVHPIWGEDLAAIWRRHSCLHFQRKQLGVHVFNV
ncbi:unnamed protein product, partial [Darwinula stevensoni]